MVLQVTPTYEGLRRKFAEQRCVVLDGGIATELPDRHDRREEHLWGVEALASSPEAVRDVHDGYVAAGADIITTNTWGLPTAVTGAAQIADERHRPLNWIEIARRGVAVAQQAIARGGREGECAVGFSINGDIDAPDGVETAQLLTRALASSPPDLIMVETLSVISPSLLDVVGALVAAGVPVWLSFRRCRRGLCGVYGQHWGGPEGDAFGRAARRLETAGVSALLVNCIPPDHVDGMVSYLRDFTDLPLGVYPNLGYHTTDGWQTESEIGGEQYAQLALRWRAEGAQIIGGCCGTRPEHISAAREALLDTVPGTVRRAPVSRRSLVPGDSDEPAPWIDDRRRALHPLPFPRITVHEGVSGVIPGTEMTWRYLFERGIGAHQRCLDVGCGAGTQTVQLALNGADHVHAIDVDERAVANTLANAFRNGVAEPVTGEVADLYPWVPGERYEVIVANLFQIPVDPTHARPSHGPVDYWGRGLVDQLLGKLPGALAAEGVALVTITSILSRIRTQQLLRVYGLSAEVVTWELTHVPDSPSWHEAHIAQIEGLSDGFRVRVGEQQRLVAYLLAIRHAGLNGSDPRPAWPAAEDLP